MNSIKPVKAPRGGRLKTASAVVLGLLLRNFDEIRLIRVVQGCGVATMVLNLAALWQLPVLFLCENNLYAMGTALRFTESVTEIARMIEVQRAYELGQSFLDQEDQRIRQAITSLTR